MFCAITWRWAVIANVVLAIRIELFWYFSLFVFNIKLWSFFSILLSYCFFFLFVLIFIFHIILSFTYTGVQNKHNAAKASTYTSKNKNIKVFEYKQAGREAGWQALINFHTLLRNERESQSVYIMYVSEWVPLSKCVCVCICYNFCWINMRLSWLRFVSFHFNSFSFDFFNALFGG